MAEQTDPRRSESFSAPETFRVQALSVQQQTLGMAMLLAYQHPHYDPANRMVTDYALQPDGTRVLNHKLALDSDLGVLVSEFRRDPKMAQAAARNNLISIVRDPRLKGNEAGQRRRLERYLDSYVQLLVSLDNAAFPETSDNKPMAGVPKYIPDGLSDMGSESNPDSSYRDREKIRVNKIEMYHQVREKLVDMFMNLGKSGLDVARSSDLERAKRYMVTYISSLLAHSMKYDHARKMKPSIGRSVTLADFMEAELAVCRHYALWASVLLQMVGITVRLLKCDMKKDGRDSFGHHAANLVRINNQWNLLDVTSPDKAKTGDVGEVFLKPLNDVNPEPVSGKEWAVDCNDGSKRTYRGRENMYWRIRHGELQ